MKLPFFKKKEGAVKKRVVGLALGGGGAKGFAHIGALKAFEENGVDFDFCAGTSAGSLIGSLYCAGVGAEEMVRVGETLQLKEVHNGFVPNDAGKIGKIVTDLIGNALIENLPKKFYAVAVNLCDGREVVIDSGPVGQAVSASCCVPLFFRPVVRGEQHLVDGGLLNNIPSDVCRMMGAERVVSVDINPTRGGGTRELGLIDVLKATFAIMGKNASIMGIKNSDVLIAPDMSKFKATSKEGYEEMMRLGYEAAMSQMDAVKQLFIGG